MNRVGTLFGTSAAGKDSALVGLSAMDNYYQRIVNDTTRHPRPGEVNGLEYNFVDSPTHQQMVNSGQYVTYATRNGRSYGVRRTELTDAWGQDLMPVGHFGPEDHTRLWQSHDEGEFCVKSILLVTPNFQTWEERMRTRVDTGLIDVEEMFNRARAALEEMSFAERNMARLAIVASKHIETTVMQIHDYFQTGQRPSVPTSVIDYFREDADAFLTKHGEV